MGKPFPGPWTFRYHPWLREVHDSAARHTVIMKAAQMGFSETGLNIVFYNIDILGNSALYVLPNKTPDATDFSSSRFDAALELSPYLANLFSDVKNVGLKRAGSVSLYIRGARSRPGLKSIPAALIIFDERDEMPQENIPLALERSSGQDIKDARYFDISTPTVDNFGIHSEFQSSTCEHFFFKCPHCGKMTELRFPESLVITADDPSDSRIKDSHLICSECQATLKHEEKSEFLADGVWVPEFPGNDTRGFQISQLYSCVRPPYELAALALKAQTSPADEQEFYNSKLGMPRVVEGASINDAQISECLGEHKNDYPHDKTGYVTMGVDVGKFFHVWVDRWFNNGVNSGDINQDSVARTLFIGKVLHAEQLDAIVNKFNPVMCVIDANPERREALKFARRFHGHVNLCFYGRGVSGKVLREPDEFTGYEITVDRTTWLDVSQGRFKKGKNGISLPLDTPYEAKEHIKALIRRYERDSSGNPVGHYVNRGPDHFAHARNYAEIALAVSMKHRKSYDIKAGA